MSGKPLIVYRYFDEAKYADAMTNGSLRISTLERCRAYENEHQGDAGEGTQSYLSGSIKGGSDDPAFVEMAMRAGFEIGPGCSDLEIHGAIHRTTIPDAYVLSTAIQRNDDLFADSFGRFCVEIVAPGLFFWRVSSVLAAQRLVNLGSYASVTYRERSYTGLEDMVPTAFVKPVYPYAEQKELRFVWSPVGPCAPVDIVAPSIRELCRRVA